MRLNPLPSDELFHFPSAARSDPQVRAWIQGRDEPLRSLVTTWFEELRACSDDVREVMHDGCATACFGDAAFAHVGAYQAHVSLYFFYGADLDDPAGLLEGTGKRARHVKLRPGRALDQAALRGLILSAFNDVHTDVGDRRRR